MSGAQMRKFMNAAKVKSGKVYLITFDDPDTPEKPDYDAPVNALRTSGYTIFDINNGPETTFLCGPISGHDSGHVKGILEDYFTNPEGTIVVAEISTDAWVWPEGDGPDRDWQQL